MSQGIDRYYHRRSTTFMLDGVTQYVEVIDATQTVRRCVHSTGEVLDEIVIPETIAGCDIYEFNVSPSGAWITTERLSGQGEWGYDILRTAPLTRIGGLDQCRGYISGPPQFAGDESRVAVLASRWLNWVDDEDKTPSPGGYVNVGWLYFLTLPDLHQTDHEVGVYLPARWRAEVESHQWHLPKRVTPACDGVGLIWAGEVVEIPGPLPEVVILPTPHPSGRGLV